MADEYKNDLNDDAAGLPDSEDDITATLREEMGKLSDDDENDADSGGFDAPLEDEEIKSRDTVEEEDGIKRVQAARDNKDAPAAKKEDTHKGEKPAEEAEPKNKDASPSGGNGEEDTKDEDGDKSKSTVATGDEYTAAIEGLPATVQERIKAQQSEHDAVMAPLKGREKQLEALGVQPKDAMQWFVNVNDYAMRDPAGYMAWVVGQSTGGDAEKAEEVLKGAAEKLGYKIEKDTGATEDDDPFMSDRERQLIQENQQLRANQQQQAQFGPDSPQEQSRRSVIEVVSEVNDQGQPLRPHFEKLQPMILAIVKQQVDTTGKPMTADDLRSAYGQAELAHPDTREEATNRLIEAKSAAQNKPNMPEKGEQNAAATAKSKAASTKIIDGPGQGAGRQPAAADADLSLEGFLRKQMQAK